MTKTAYMIRTGPLLIPLPDQGKASLLEEGILFSPPPPSERSIIPDPMERLFGPEEARISVEGGVLIPYSSIREASTFRLLPLGARFVRLAYLDRRGAATRA